jgi:hypothetical protein
MIHCGLYSCDININDGDIDPRTGEQESCLPKEQSIPSGKQVAEVIRCRKTLVSKDLAPLPEPKLLHERVECRARQLSFLVPESRRNLLHNALLQLIGEHSAPAWHKSPE